MLNRTAKHYPPQGTCWCERVFFMLHLVLTDRASSCLCAGTRCIEERFFQNIRNRFLLYAALWHAVQLPVEFLYAFCRAKAPYEQHDDIAQDILQAVLFVEFVLHDLLHHAVAQQADQFVIEVAAEKAFLYATLKKIFAMCVMFLLHVLYEGHYARVFVQILVENGVQVAYTFHLQPVELENDIDHLHMVLGAIAIHLVVESVYVAFYAFQKQLFLVFVYFIQGALGNLQLAGNIVHFDRLHTNGGELAIGKIQYLFAK